MRSTTKLGILWIIGLIYFPFGIFLIQEVDTGLSIGIAFAMVILICVFSVYYSIIDD